MVKVSFDETQERVIESLNETIKELNGNLEGIQRHMKQLEEQHKESLLSTSHRVDGLERNHYQRVYAIEQQVFNYFFCVISFQFGTLLSKAEEERSVLEAKIDQLKHERGVFM